MNIDKFKKQLQLLGISYTNKILFTDKLECIYDKTNNIIIDAQNNNECYICVSKNISVSANLSLLTNELNNILNTNRFLIIFINTNLDELHQSLFNSSENNNTFVKILSNVTLL